MVKAQPDIDFITDSGKKVVLKWEKVEYRAYEANGRDMRLGATKPDNLILYIKKNF